jgi:hypothetical protein
MVPWWKRLLYSLLSVMLGAGLSGAWVAAREFIANSHGRISAIALSTTILFFDSWVVLLSLPGWLLAIPVVLLVKNIRGWRFWMFWGLGVCFGPALILGASLYTALGAAAFAGFSRDLLPLTFMAGAVSGLTTLIYLLLLRWSQARSLLRTSI